MREYLLVFSFFVTSWLGMRGLEAYFSSSVIPPSCVFIAAAAFALFILFYSLPSSFPATTTLRQPDASSKHFSFAPRLLFRHAFRTLLSEHGLGEVVFLLAVILLSVCSALFSSSSSLLGFVVGRQHLLIVFTVIYLVTHLPFHAYKALMTIGKHCCDLVVRPHPSNEATAILLPAPPSFSSSSPSCCIATTKHRRAMKMDHLVDYASALVRSFACSSLARIAVVGALLFTLVLCFVDLPLTSVSWLYLGRVRGKTCSSHITTSYFGATPPVVSRPSSSAHPVSDAMRGVLYAFAPLGDVPMTYPGLLWVYVLSHLFLGLLFPLRSDDDHHQQEKVHYLLFVNRIRRFLQLPLVVTIYTGAVSALLKLAIHRQRPSVAQTAFDFSGPSMTWVDHSGFSKTDLSLPSGHAAVTASVAWLLSSLYMEYKEASPLASQQEQADRRPRRFLFFQRGCLFLLSFILCFLVALTRFSQCFHWPSDCVAGAVIGILVAEIVMKAFDPFPHHTEKS